MGLYRNIAGFEFVEGERVGLTLLPLGDMTTTFTKPQIIDTVPLPTGLPNILDIWKERQEALEPIYEAMAAQKRERYDWLMANTPYDIDNLGYYVTLDNGSIFQWTDEARTTSRAWLPIQDIQDIENERGTAGALLLHMNQPLLAKDTAGYAGGGQASQGATTMYSDPIPEVKEIPDQGLPDGAIPFEPVIEISIPETGGDDPAPTTTTPITPTNTTTTDNQVKPGLSWLPLLTIGGLLFVAFKGEKVFKKTRGLVFIGGLGALYYQFSKKT